MSEFTCPVCNATGSLPLCQCGVLIEGTWDDDDEQLDDGENTDAC